MLPSSQNELLLFEKATLCERFVTFSEGTILNFPLLFSRWIELFRSLSSGFPSELIPGKQICSINLNSFSELRTFSVCYVCYSCGYWLLFRENSLLGDGNDNVAGYNSWTSGMKPVFRLFCVLVIVSQTETRGS